MPRHAALLIALASLVFGIATSPAAAQTPGGAPGAPVAQVPPVPADTKAVAPEAHPVHLQTGDEALAQDAAEYSRRFGVDASEALHRLRVQQETAPYTDAIAARFVDRLAGIVIEHAPAWRIVVLLTGDAPVPDEIVSADGAVVPILYRTGALATRERLLAALANHQPALRRAMAHPPSFAVDPRTGTLLVLAQASDIDAEGVEALAARLSGIAGVPVTIRRADRSVNMAVQGGSRVVGTDPADGKRYACTTGFVVTDGIRSAIVTAAHCPDTLSYVDIGQRSVPLSFAGQWGWGYQDVQVNVAPAPLAPLFYADTAKSLARSATGAQPRGGIRAGDFVCHRGERTGYSCGTVDLTDFAPAGDLCGGDCVANWVTVSGPDCQGGDSGAPVFLGTTAYGIVKGGTRGRDGVCPFYYFMSLDYLPQGWSLATVTPASLRPPPVPVPE